MIEETVVDKLLEIIDSGPATVAKLSKALGVDKQKVERWAEILENRGLVDIEYPLMGSPSIKKPDKKQQAQEATAKKKRIKDHSGPTMTLMITLAFVMVLLIAYYVGLVDLGDGRAGGFSTKTERNESNTSSPGNSLTNPLIIDIFNRMEDSASYTAISTYGDYERVNTVYLNKGKIRVEWPDSGKTVIFDGTKSAVINKEGKSEVLSEVAFNTEVMPLMPWTYTNMLTGGLTTTTKSTVDGIECSEFPTPDGDVICMSMEKGFPLRYESMDMKLIFKDLNLNPTLEDSLFQI